MDTWTNETESGAQKENLAYTVNTYSTREPRILTVSSIHGTRETENSHAKGGNWNSVLHHS